MNAAHLKTLSFSPSLCVCMSVCLCVYYNQYTLVKLKKSVFFFQNPFCNTYFCKIESQESKYQHGVKAIPFFHFLTGEILFRLLNSDVSSRANFSNLPTPQKCKTTITLNLPANGSNRHCKIICLEGTRLRRTVINV